LMIDDPVDIVNAMLGELQHNYGSDTANTPLPRAVWIIALILA
jgi:hypothetical protein